MSALYGSVKGYVHYLGDRFVHRSVHTHILNFLANSIRLLMAYCIRCYEHSVNHIHCYHIRLKTVINKILQPARKVIFAVRGFIRKQIRTIKEFLYRQVWFAKLHWFYVTKRIQISIVVKYYLRIIKEQLDRVPEPEWVAKTRKTYNENEKIVRLREISKKEVVSSEKHNARVIIWSIVFVLVIYSGFNKALEFTYKPDIENELSLFFERKIKIDSLSFDFFPGIRLLAKNVLSNTDDGKTDARIRSIYLGVDFVELLSGDLNINYLHIDHAIVDQDFLLDLPSTFNKSGGDTEDSSSININTFTASPVKIMTGGKKDLGEYRVAVIMTPEQNLKLIKVMPATSNNMNLIVIPNGEMFDFDLQASNWRIPSEYPIVLQSAEIKGTFDDNKLVTKQMTGELYGGKFDGDLSLIWADKLDLIASIHLNKVDSGKFLQSAGQKIITGKMDYKGVLKINDLASENLWPNTWIKADFSFKNGVIYKADLEKASSLINKKGTKGGKTRFDEFKGKIFAESGNIQLKELEISSSALAAQGHLKINRNNKLNGEIDVGFNNTKGILTVPLKISGTVNEPSLRPTNEAMAGAAIGTVILGPGVGTALGVKAGKVVTWFKELMNRDKKKQEKNK